MSSHAVQTHVKLILCRKEGRASVAFIAGGENIKMSNGSDIRCEWCYPVSAGRCSHNCMCSMMAGYIEAQIKQRTAYVSKAMVRPPTTPLNLRILALVMFAVQNSSV